MDCCRDLPPLTTRGVLRTSLAVVDVRARLWCGADVGLHDRGSSARRPDQCRQCGEHPENQQCKGLSAPGHRSNSISVPTPRIEMREPSAVLATRDRLVVITSLASVERSGPTPCPARLESRSNWLL